MEFETISNTSTGKTPFFEDQSVENIARLKESIPDHLKEFIVEQDTTQYQPIDHAVWRYSLRQLKNYLADNAHDCYLDGLQKTGITVDSIPSIDSICKNLQKFGWSAVPVSGFIPPAAFMEMQSLGILPIASDMRSLDHILYTPAPDIVHEAAGHAPILIHPDFAKYLKQYTTVAKNAIVSSEDLALYEAIRDLSDIKEHPDSTPEQIAEASKKLDDIANNMTVTSEATLLGRMNWWTAEYGLIGSLEAPKIYGAGLLSSYGEAKECLQDHVKKIPLSVDCVNYTYDITEPQPQLFVAKSFEDLTRVLHELSLTLSYKKGGIDGLERAIEAKTVNTIQLNSGLQISGQVVDCLVDDGECVYFRLEGPTQLSIGGHQIPGHDKDFHSHGFSSPLGYVDGFDDCLSWASTEDLASLGLIQGQKATLRFESGVLVEGEVQGTQRTPRKELCLISWKDCTVTFKGKKLFLPEWGTFDMAVGHKVESVFSGPADRKSYGHTDAFPQKRVPRRQISSQETELNQFYQKIRDLRNSGQTDAQSLNTVFAALEKSCPDDWLTRVELLELCHRTQETGQLRDLLTSSLQGIKLRHPDKATVIDDGIQLADKTL
jgi:phenylalanine-4-hydroxylase